MKVNKLELLNALNKVRPGLASRELIEQSTSFAFVGNQVVTYNDEISISHPVPGMDVTGAVKAQALFGFLNKVKTDVIDMEWQDNQVIIKAGRAKAGLVFEAQVKLPLQEEIGNINKWMALPDKFIEALKLCYPCTSKDMSRPIITCVHISDNIVEASDTFQIIRYTLPAKVPGVKSVLIPANSIRELIRYAIIEMAVSGSWVHFRTEDGTIFSTRTIEGVFPDTTPFLEINGDEFLFPDTMKGALDKASIFSRNDLTPGEIPTVSIQVTDARITVIAKNDHGWFEEKLKSSFQGRSFTFFIGIEFLITLFDRLQTCIISQDKIGFSGKNWQHIISIQSEEREE